MIKVLLLTLLFPAMVAASIVEHRLDNGLKVITYTDRASPVSTFQVWYRVGGIDEPEGKSGISHLLEHLMFRGSKNYPGNVFSKIIQANGGVDNAFTTKDYTVYFQRLSPEKLEISINLESDRMANLLLSKEDFELEKKIVLEERRQRYEDDPENLIFEEVIGTAFKNHPYRRPVIGWTEEIERITLEDVKEHYRRFYCPENAFIIVAGDIDERKVLDKVRDRFGKVPSCNSLPRRNNSLEPKQQGERRVILKRQTHMPVLVLAYKVPAFPDRDSLAIELLSNILGGGKSSRLYRRLAVDRDLVVDVATSNSSLSREGFLFFVYAYVKDVSKVEEVERIIREEIDRIKVEAPNERELEKAKNQVEASFLFSQDSVFGHSLYLGRFEILGSWRLIDNYRNTILSLNPSDIQSSAKRYLTDDNLTVGILLPR